LHLIESEDTIKLARQKCVYNGMLRFLQKLWFYLCEEVCRILLVSKPLYRLLKY